MYSQHSHIQRLFHRTGSSILVTVILGSGLAISPRAIATSELNASKFSAFDNSLKSANLPQRDLATLSHSFWSRNFWLSQASTLPPAIATSILGKAAAQFNVDPNQLEILDTSPKVWSDGCLGLGGLRLDCAERLTPGWQVVVTNSAAFYAPRWVYRTNQAGSLIVWDAAGSQMIASLIQAPRRLSDAQLPPALPPGAIFRVVSYDSRRTNPQVTFLYGDGQIIQERMNSRGEPLQRTLRQLTPSQIEQFQALLTERRFARFDRYDFLAAEEPLDTAPYRVIVVSSVDATLRFADVDEYRLTADLSTILMTWNHLVERGRFP